MKANSNRDSDSPRRGRHGRNNKLPCGGVANQLQDYCRNQNCRRGAGSHRAKHRANRSVRSRRPLRWTGPDTRLIVLPEYVLTGFPMGESPEEWIAKACLSDGCGEYEALGRIAEKNNVFLAGNGYESDPNFPEIFFQTSFIIDPSGDVILRYRRLNSMFSPTPHDVWDRYLDIYGLEARLSLWPKLRSGGSQRWPRRRSSIPSFRAASPCAAQR